MLGIGGVTVIVSVIVISGRVAWSEGIGDTIIIGTDNFSAGLGQGIYGPLHLNKPQGQSHCLSYANPKRQTRTHVGSELKGENRRVNNTNVRQTVHFQSSIYNTSLVLRQHRKRIRRVEFRLNIVGNKGIDVSVSRDSRAGADLSTEDGTERGGSRNLPSELYSLPHQRNISLMRQASRVEGRIVKGIVGGNV